MTNEEIKTILNLIYKTAERKPLLTKLVRAAKAEGYEAEELGNWIEFRFSISDDELDTTTTQGAAHKDEYSILIQEELIKRLVYYREQEEVYYGLKNEKKQEFLDTVDRQWKNKKMSEPARKLAEDTLAQCDIVARRLGVLYRGAED